MDIGHSIQTKYGRVGNIQYANMIISIITAVITNRIFKNLYLDCCTYHNKIILCGYIVLNKNNS